ncbi:MAG: prolipoprotein diacylglyceryl transferase [Candidatus Sericytochromatia bacterium]|nr:prolipoprotein diacylglyceryl transferase [Candidatus Sericytochromatia bacterium]
MIPYPQIGPDIVALGPIHIRWYGMSYLMGFFLGYLLLKKRNVETGLKLDQELLADFAFYIFLGVILGGRLGYVLFYHPMLYLTHPEEILYIFRGGMSFHGGMIGTWIAGYLFCKKHGIHFYRLADAVIPAIPIGLGLGRLGNFINGELWGRPTDVPWAMVFPMDPTGLPRHPSQLYEFGLEGVLIFTILMAMRRLPLPPGFLFWSFVTLYAMARITSEFFREPDAHLAFLFSQITAGMLLSLPMLVVGIVMLVVLGWRKDRGTNLPAAS